MAKIVYLCYWTSILVLLTVYFIFQKCIQSQEIRHAVLVPLCIVKMQKLIGRARYPFVTLNAGVVNF